MPQIQRCPKCRGKKIIHGMGMMEKTCDTCFGLGKLEIKDAPIPVETDANNDSRETLTQQDEQPKRRGRKPKERT
jgi:hypothetical protein